MTDFTFRQAVHAIGIATYPARPFPRSFRDNDPVSQLLCIDWRTNAGRDAWLDYFGAKLDGNVAWSSDWHGWRVLMTAHFADVEDSGPVGIEQRHGSPPADPGTSVADTTPVTGFHILHLTQTDSDMFKASCHCGKWSPLVLVTREEARDVHDLHLVNVTDDDMKGAANRVAGLRSYEDLERGAFLASAMLDPDATLQIPAVVDYRTVTP